MNPGWNGTLGLYSDFLRAAAATGAWEVADIHSPMTEFNRAQQEINPKFSVVSPDDRVHPNAAGWFQKKVPDYIGNWPGRAATRAKIDAIDRELDALRKPVARAWSLRLRKEGEVMLKARGLSPAEGQIQIHSERHGVEIRRITIKPL